jgi:SSS family solute:Na+ symporter
MVFLTYYVWPDTRFPCTAPSGEPFIGLLVAYICRGLGIKDNEETIKRQAEVRAFLDDIDEPSRNLARSGAAP